MYTGKKGTKADAADGRQEGRAYLQLERGAMGPPSSSHRCRHHPTYDITQGLPPSRECWSCWRLWTYAANMRNRPKV